MDNLGKILSSKERSVYKNSNMTRRLYTKIFKIVHCDRDKIANFSRPHCLAIPRRDLSAKRVKEVNYGHNVKIASIGNSHF